MRNFICVFKSDKNLFRGTLHVKASTVSEAQDKFFEWLKEQPSYPHLWQLTFELTEIRGSL